MGGRERATDAPSRNKYAGMAKFECEWPYYYFFLVLTKTANGNGRRFFFLIIESWLLKCLAVRKKSPYRSNSIVNDVT